MIALCKVTGWSLSDFEHRRLSSIRFWFAQAIEYQKLEAKATEEASKPKK